MILEVSFFLEYINKIERKSLHTLHLRTCKISFHLRKCFAACVCMNCVCLFEFALRQSFFSIFFCFFRFFFFFSLVSFYRSNQDYGIKSVQKSTTTTKMAKTEKFKPFHIVRFVMFGLVCPTIRQERTKAYATRSMNLCICFQHSNERVQWQWVFSTISVFVRVLCVAGVCTRAHQLLNEMKFQASSEWKQKGFFFSSKWAKIMLFFFFFSGSIYL